MTADENNERRERIVVAWDGSWLSASTFPIAAIIGKQLGARVEIQHVLRAGSSAEEVVRLLTVVGLHGLDASQLQTITGEAVRVILAAAADPDVILVILTTHADSLEQGRYLGSVARAVIVQARDPVLLYRPEAAWRPRELRRLLLPVDGTPKTAWALEPATSLAQRLGAALDLLHVAGRRSEAPAERGSIAAPRYVDHPEHEWADWADEVGDRLARSCASAPPGVEIRAFLAQGDVPTEIRNFAVEHESDAIVLVRRSRLQPGRARTLLSVLERAPCPVLMLHGAEDNPSRSERHV